MNLLDVRTAAGTAYTNATAETLLGSAILKAGTLQVGKIIRVHAAVRATATNSTNTLRVDVRVGPTTLTGTIVATAAATDVADNDVVIVDLWGVVRSVGASGVVLWSGTCSVPGAEGTGTSRVALEVDTVDSTADQRIELTGTWSAASASNSAQLESLIVAELV